MASFRRYTFPNDMRLVINIRTRESYLMPPWCAHISHTIPRDQAAALMRAWRREGYRRRPVTY